MRTGQEAATACPPDGYEVRAPRWEEAAAVAELMRATELAIAPEVAPETTPEDVATEWRGIDMERDHWVAIEPGGEPAAYGALYERGEEYPLIDVYVHPDHRGRGLGSFLVARAEHDMRLRMRATERAEVTVHNGVMATDSAARALLEAHGYAPARHFYRMAVALPTSLPNAPLPDGIVVAPIAAGRARDVHGAIEEGFEQEWGHSPESFEDWMGRKEREGWDPTLVFVALDGESVAGVAQCSRRFGGGWVNALAVLPPWRRRGIGHALLVEALREFERRGEPRVALGVDAQNPTGATRLYERAGMTVEWEAMVFEKTLERGADGRP